MCFPISKHLVINIFLSSYSYIDSIKVENSTVDNCKANFIVDLALMARDKLCNLAKHNVALIFVGVNSVHAYILSSTIKKKHCALTTFLIHILTILLIVIFKKFRIHISVYVSNKF